VLSCDTQNTDTHTLVTVSGEVDLDTCGRLWDALRPCLRPGARTVLDGSGITFIDCCGLRILELARLRADAGGGRLVLAAPSEPMLRLMELAGVTDSFTIVGRARPPIPQPSTRRIGNRARGLPRSVGQPVR